MRTVFGLGAVLGAAAALLPARALRKRAARAIARAGLRASGLPLQVVGVAALQGGSWIVVSNHASYLDWLVLTAVLPAPACFVAKRELARSALLRWVLERMGVHFVERDDVHASVEDAKRLVQASKAGEMLVYFPEGTLTRAPGLRPFHMGRSRRRRRRASGWCRSACAARDPCCAMDRGGCTADRWRCRSTSYCPPRATPEPRR